MSEVCIYYKCLHDPRPLDAHLISACLLYTAMNFLLSLMFFLISGAMGVMIGPNADIVISNAIVAPDGFSRGAVVAGGLLPGPSIKGNKGDVFNLNVVNELNDPTMLQSTSIHWHGLFQKNSSWADGPAFASQCPISANHSFLYTFPTGHQSGTFWYHSHLSTQYCDGLRGAFVIYDPNDPWQHLYDVDDESTIITLSDWYHMPAKNLGNPPFPFTTLINGLGRYTEGPASKLAVIKVDHGRRYRFRLVAISCDANFVFTIDAHTFTIIEVDGVSHAPHTVDSMHIFAGQRYSFVLTARQAVSNYWIRAVSSSADSVGAQGFDNGINSAILRYVGAPAHNPVTNTTTSVIPLVETDLHPLVQSSVPGRPVPGGADVNLNLVFGTNFTSQLFTINGASYIPRALVYPLPPNKVIEVSVPGGTQSGPHPFHLHGHNFHVIRSAGNSSYNFVNPVIRDVVSTGPAVTDNVTIRFVTDNAGPWFLHCHIDTHLEGGLAIIFAEDIPTVQKSVHPPAWDTLCPIYNALSPSQL
ncbi:laccase 1 [Mycena rebaudengoi]|nr:laccase 1 [Mycena rebaudengoi]